METTLEFNPIKTIKIINKHDILKSVYEETTTEDFNYLKIIEKAKTDTLPDASFNVLKEMFESIIAIKDSFRKAYEKAEVSDPKTPKRYGKQQILKDIENQGGTPTQIQETMLLLAELKAVLGTLQVRGVSDHYKGTNKISDTDHKKIAKAVKTFVKIIK